MKVILYKTTSESNRINKTLTDAHELTGTLRDGCDLLRPVLRITTINPTAYNYAYIPEFDRYYFITGFESVRNNIFEVSFAVDVLYTYRNEILKLNGVTDESDNGNPYDAGADYSTDVRETVKNYDFENNFNEAGQLVLIAVGSNM